MRAPAKLTTVMSTKGQVILPKAIRQGRNWPPGTKLTVEETPDGVLLRQEPLIKPTTVDQVFGMLKYDGPPVSIEEMNRRMMMAIAEDDARIMRDDRENRDRD